MAPPHSHVSEIPSSSSSRAPTSKQKIREMKLRSDPLVEVLSATLVRCLNCGVEIKLSPKSAYDASHWTRHRGRCLKKSRAREVTARAVQVVEPQSQSSPSSRAASPEPEQDVDEPNEPEDRDAHGRYRAEVAPVPEFTRWKSWDWSQLRCSFRAPDY
uniref:Uncharacterized protein n=1 Tax=Mycena chlorophos TaxID=658473 RepID=A0ABQ0L8I0_MYCCL|nr:predicted protein [Mycena chlorophos]